MFLEYIWIIHKEQKYVKKIKKNQPKQPPPKHKTKPKPIITENKEEGIQDQIIKMWFTYFYHKNRVVAWYMLTRCSYMKVLSLFNDLRCRIHILQVVLAEKTFHFKSSKVVLIGCLLTLKVKS